MTTIMSLDRRVLIGLTQTIIFHTVETAAEKQTTNTIIV